MCTWRCAEYFIRIISNPPQQFYEGATFVIPIFISGETEVPRCEVTFPKWTSQNLDPNLLDQTRLANCSGFPEVLLVLALKVLLTRKPPALGRTSRLATQIHCSAPPGSLLYTHLTFFCVAYTLQMHVNHVIWCLTHSKCLKVGAVITGPISSSSGYIVTVI